MVISMAKWKGKVAVVTGASAGIGAALVEKLVNEGLIVAGLARRKEKLDQLASSLKNHPGKFHPFKADVSKEEEIQAVFKHITEKLGPIHILVNNAGFKRNTNLTDGDTKLWKEILDTNVLGLCVATREAVKSMRANHVDGHIVHINSVSGHPSTFNYLPQHSVYPASKHAVTALTETLRQELNSIGSKIKVTSVSPGAVATEFLEAAGMITKGEKKSVDKKPILQPEDVVDAIVYALATPKHVQVHEVILRPI